MNRAERRRQQRDKRRGDARPGILAPQVDALIEEGIARHRVGDFNNAATAYLHALSIDPDNSRANYLRGIALHQAGRGLQGIPHLERAIAAEPVNATYHLDLGNLHEGCGQPDLAQAAFQRAIVFDPNLIDARYNLGNSLLAQGSFERAIEAYQDLLRIRPNHARAQSNLGNALQSLGRLEEAQAAYVRTLELSPANHAVRHMLRALQGATPRKPPVEFVSRLFDRYAPRFEAHVTQALGYSIPEELHAALVELMGEDFEFSRVADLGAGTGLCGELLRRHANELVAIDLSPNMLAAARNKGIYDSILIGDITDELAKRDDTFDLFIAADVFIYVGALEELFGAVRERRTAGAYFAFSIERSESEDFVLQVTGRYAHAVSYIKRLARDYEFDIALTRPAKIRKEKDGWITGDIFVVRARGEATHPRTRAGAEIP